jgi:hypothetical protein
MKMAVRNLTKTAAILLAVVCMNAARATASDGNFTNERATQLLSLSSATFAEAHVRFYANDVTNTFPAFQILGNFGYENGWAVSTTTPGSTLLFDISKGANLSITGRIPDSFVWPGQIQNLGVGLPAGLDLYEAPTIWGNYNEYWDNNAAGGWQSRGTSPPPTALATPVSPTPEPTIIGIGLLGGLAVLMLRNHLRRN